MRYSHIALRSILGLRFWGVLTLIFFLFVDTLCCFLKSRGKGRVSPSQQSRGALQGRTVLPFLEAALSQTKRVLWPEARRENQLVFSANLPRFWCNFSAFPVQVWTSFGCFWCKFAPVSGVSLRLFWPFQTKQQWTIRRREPKRGTHGDMVL